MKETKKLPCRIRQYKNIILYSLMAAAVTVMAVSIHNLEANIHVEISIGMYVASVAWIILFSLINRDRL